MEARVFADVCADDAGYSAAPVAPHPVASAKASDSAIAAASAFIGAFRIDIDGTGAYRVGHGLLGLVGRRWRGGADDPAVRSERPRGQARTWLDAGRPCGQNRPCDRPSLPHRAW